MTEPETTELDQFRATLIDIFQGRDWSITRKSRKSCLGNIDTFFAHRQSIQPLNVRVGQAMEHALLAATRLSSLVSVSPLAGTKVDGVNTHSSISGQKQVDNAFVKDDILYVLEHKSSADMDNKGWAEVLLGASKVAERVAVLMSHDPAKVCCVILCQNDLSDKTTKHRYAESLVQNLEENLNLSPIVKGWDWLFDMIGWTSITEQQYYDTLAALGEMITGERQWGVWPTQTVDEQILQF